MGRIALYKCNLKFQIEHGASSTATVSVDIEQKISLAAAAAAAAAAVRAGREELVQGLVKVTKSTKMFQKLTVVQFFSLSVEGK